MKSSENMPCRTATAEVVVLLIEKITSGHAEQRPLSTGSDSSDTISRWGLVMTSAVCHTPSLPVSHRNKKHCNPDHRGLYAEHHAPITRSRRNLRLTAVAHR